MPRRAQVAVIDQIMSLRCLPSGPSPVQSPSLSLSIGILTEALVSTVAGRVATGEVAVHFVLEADPGFQHGVSTLRLPAAREDKPRINFHKDMVQVDFSCGSGLEFFPVSRGD